MSTNDSNKMAGEEVRTHLGSGSPEAAPSLRHWSGEELQAKTDALPRKFEPADGKLPIHDEQRVGGNVAHVRGQDMDPSTHLTADETFGGQVYSHRLRLGFAQADVASRARISQAYFSGLENSKRPAPPLRTVWRIAQALSLDPRDTQYLCVLAEKERAVALRDEAFAPDVNDLLALIRACAPTMGRGLVARIRNTIREACM